MVFGVAALLIPVAAGAHPRQIGHSSVAGPQLDEETEVPSLDFEIAPGLQTVLSQRLPVAPTALPAVQPDVADLIVFDPQLAFYAPFLNMPPIGTFETNTAHAVRTIRPYSYDAACQELSNQQEQATDYWVASSFGLPGEKPPQSSRVHTAAFSDYLSLAQPDSMNAPNMEPSADSDPNLTNAVDRPGYWCAPPPEANWATEPFSRIVWGPFLILALGILLFMGVRGLRRP